MAKTIRTMEDFSDFVGLSRTTVSKYFNDPNSVRKNTRSAIEAALKKSDFRPSMFAVNLNRRRSNILGARGCARAGHAQLFKDIVRRLDNLCTIP